jgi:hypothetical protein
MDLGGGVGDAWEILANVGGNRGQPGSCALALPYVQAGPVGTSVTRTGGVIDVAPGVATVAGRQLRISLMTSL